MVRSVPIQPRDRPTALGGRGERHIVRVIYDLDDLPPRPPATWSAPTRRQIRTACGIELLGDVDVEFHANQTCHRCTAVEDQ